MKSALIVMAKPPVLGRCKTRLANEIGDSKALHCYRLMLNRTFEIAQIDRVDTFVFFTEEGEYSKEFSLFPHYIQESGDLGIKMLASFKTLFELSYERVVMIGTDCPDNDKVNILHAFEQLNDADVSIGKSEDGGYYLIGMNELHKELFEDKKWSTEFVFEEAIRSIQGKNLKYAQIETLNDIDNLLDLERSEFFKNNRIE